ncbi:hypothetical protein EMIT0111MI5_220040 [Burkholderia sp. IT-111MI5]
MRPSPLDDTPFASPRMTTGPERGAGTPSLLDPEAWDPARRRRADPDRHWRKKWTTRIRPRRKSNASIR